MILLHDARITKLISTPEHESMFLFWLWKHSVIIVSWIIYLLDHLEKLDYFVGTEEVEEVFAEDYDEPVKDEPVLPEPASEIRVKQPVEEEDNTLREVFTMIYEISFCTPWNQCSAVLEIIAPHLIKLVFCSWLN